MRLPDDPRVLGWYRFGRRPGGGRVGGARRPRRLPRVRRRAAGPTAGVRAGDGVEVGLGPGRGSSYRVDSVERFDRQALPAAVFARTGPERLRIVTCTGPYLPEQGGYQQNLWSPPSPTEARLRRRIEGRTTPHPVTARDVTGMLGAVGAGNDPGAADAPREDESGAELVTACLAAQLVALEEQDRALRAVASRGCTG